MHDQAAQGLDLALVGLELTGELLVHLHEDGDILEVSNGLARRRHRGGVRSDRRRDGGAGLGGGGDGLALAAVRLEDSGFASPGVQGRYGWSVLEFLGDDDACVGLLHARLAGLFEQFQGVDLVWIVYGEGKVPMVVLQFVWWGGCFRRQRGECAFRRI